ncbi:MAG TPA: DoxX family protein [Desulfofustis sp.]|jgi:hypothetical protein|nr:DoxX family protein [Desulfofustis sp.]HBH31469.1 DoxX family protein [Desulfofustis sp.]
MATDYSLPNDATGNLVTRYRPTKTQIVWVVRLCCWVVAVVFLRASLPKLAAPYEFGAVISMYGLVPLWLIMPTAYILPAAEFVTACGLFCIRRWAMILAGLQLLLFIGVLSYGIALGLDVDCGCFDPGDPQGEAIHGLRSALIRDLVLLVVLAIGWWGKRLTTNNQGE